MADACHPEELLENPEVQSILNGRRDVAFVAWGLGTFIRDEGLSHLARYLYDWSGSKSCFVFHAQGAGAETNDEAMIKVRKIYEQMGTPLTMRSLEHYAELIRPWHLDEPGFVPLLKWHGLDPSIMGEADVRNFGPGGIGYGAYLSK